MNNAVQIRTAGYSEAKAHQMLENSTDHFCEDTRQNALAALTNHITPF